MIKSLLASVAAFVLRTPSIEKALSSLEKTLGHLEAAQEHHVNRSMKFNKIASSAEYERDRAMAEAERAGRVSDRLATLLA
jgi:hypothetical protein